MPRARLYNQTRRNFLYVFKEAPASPSPASPPLAFGPAVRPCRAGVLLSRRKPSSIGHQDRRPMLVRFRPQAGPRGLARPYRSIGLVDQDR
jgi:hypothetical protein